MPLSFRFSLRFLPLFDRVLRWSLQRPQRNDQLNSLLAPQKEGEANLPQVTKMGYRHPQQAYRPQESQTPSAPLPAGL